MNFLSHFQKRVIKDPKKTLWLLIAWTVLLNGYGLGSLEFIRHTEADRTLISQELLENNDFLVPTLLGSEILTKPPLYYWTSALFLKIFDHHSVLVARLTSLLASAIFVAGTYLFWLSLTGRRRLSALAAFALSTSVLFYILASVAEIDMIFGCFCALSLYAGFLLYERPRIRNIVLYASLLALAFLAKGPPVYFFNMGAFGLLFLYDFITLNKKKELLIKAAVLGSGLVLSAAILSIWLFPLGYRVGWEALGSRLEEEVFSRVTSYSERDRGAFFYISAFIVNALPWSFFLVLGIFHLFRIKSSHAVWFHDLGGFFKEVAIRRIFLFSLMVAYSGFMMLSIAQGKSSRYAFAVIPFFVNIAVLFSPIILMRPYFKYVVSSYRIVSVVAVFIFVGLFVFGSLDAVSTLDWIIAGVFVIIASLFGIYGTALMFWRNAVLLVAFLFFTVKVVQTHVFVPQRNHTRTVLHIAKELVDIQKETKEPFFTIELFKRWTVFYAKADGAKTLRLSPKIVSERISKEGRAYLLLDLEEESWRYYQALMYSSDVRVERIFPHPSAASFIISVPNKILDKLAVYKSFPTHPSIPFYPELKQKSDL